MVDNKNVMGQIQISDEVIAIIAATAASEVEGVQNGSNDVANSIVEFFGKKSQSRGVRVVVENGEAEINVEIGVIYGFKIHECAQAVQIKVKNAVETMTGLTVVTVNVNVAVISVIKKTDDDCCEDELGE